MDYPRDRKLITYQELEVFVDWQYKFEIAKETYLILTTGPTIRSVSVKILGFIWEIFRYLMINSHIHS